jgi:hypothetical protein
VQRVVELLAQAGAQVSQPVKLSGIVDNEPITYLDIAGVAPRPVRQPAATRGMEATGVPEAPEEARRVQGLLDSVLQLTRTVEPALRHTWVKYFAVGHALFGSEQVTEILTRRLKLYALGKGR